MENSLPWEYQALIKELTQGMEKAKQLRFHLCSTTPSEAQNLLLQRILSSYEKALLILKWSDSKEQHQDAGAMSAAIESSVSVDGSPRSEDLNKNYREHQDYSNNSKKRKMQPTWTEKIKVSSENGLEGPTDDGYSWRKYGQKDILGAKYPRSYYRCTYRLVQNCWATKQVQRSDEDPTIFDITYKGTHTCNHCTNAALPPASPEKQELRYSSHDQQHSQILSNFKATLTVNTKDLGNEDLSAQFSFPPTYASHEEENYFCPISALGGNHQSTYSPTFFSPATSESNYFSASTYQMKSSWAAGAAITKLNHSKADIISSHASSSNSPIGGMEFSIDYADLDPNFPFNTTEIFTHSNYEF